MIHIVLTILKIIGILILVLIGILVLLILTLLFVPVRYRCTVRKPKAGTQDLEVRLRISWFLRMIQMEVIYGDGAFSNRFRIAGIPAERLKRGKRTPSPDEGGAKAEEGPPESKRAEAEPDPSAKRISDRESEESETLKCDGAESKMEIPDSAETLPEEKAPLFWRLFEYPFRILFLLIRTMLWILEFPFRVLGFGGRLKKRLSGFKKKWTQWKRFLTSDVFLRSLYHVKNEILCMVRHILPRRVKGWIRYGFSDPALTGETLGVIGMLMQKIPRELTIIPVFEEEILRLDFLAVGRLYGYAAAQMAWRLFFDKNLRRLWKIWKKKHS